VSGSGARALAALACAVVVLASCGDDTTGAADDPTEPAMVSDSTGADPSTSPSGSPSSSPTDAPTTASPSDEPKTEPTCDSVWVEGKRFETGYKGCYNGERWVKARPLYCSFGGKLFTYDAHFWATPNKPVHHAPRGLAKDPDYRQALGACTA